jgi:glyceraldehyde-3-phosphate dehydrogenase (NADP+)
MMLRITLIISFILVLFADPQTCANTGVKSTGYLSSDDPNYSSKPQIDGKFVFMNGVIEPWAKESDEVSSPILDSQTGERIVIGSMSRMSEADALNVMASAKKAWNHGQGIWPQMTMNDRIKTIENIVSSLKLKREVIINALMWEICKNHVDAALEFDRTMDFIDSTIKAFKEMDGYGENIWRNVKGVMARIRRAAIGIMLCLGPFNYPFNETYATLIPALLAGNIVIMKIPSVGGLVHMLTAEVYAKHLPAGTINFITGSGRVTMGPIMATGDIDMLAFIGGSNAADSLIKSHPNPHRLHVFLQLEGKNMGIVLPDANVDVAVEQITIGSTSYNGQRCTAIKLIFVHESVVEAFLPKFIARVASLKVGLPFEGNTDITPLPERDRPGYLQALIDDAVEKGAKVINADCAGGKLSGSLMTPAIVYPVTSDMRLWKEEQFGPVIPIAKFTDISEVIDVIKTTSFGQQAAIFTSEGSAASASLVDSLATVVGRININTQCGRSPDVYPFSGRRSSALGTMSVTDAIREFSIETVVAAKYSNENEAILHEFEKSSRFMTPLQ